MNIHGIIDIIALSISSLAVRKSKYFREGIESATIAEHLDNISVNLPEITGKGLYEFKAKSLVGDLETAVKVARWKGTNYPTIIFHHGAAEDPFDYSFNHIFPLKESDIPANLIAIQAPFCKSFKDFLTGIKTLENYVAMLAVSTKIVEELVKLCSGKTIISGVSLGGFVTNLHHTYFDTADYYKPLFAGSEIAEALLDSAYDKMAAPIAKENSDKIRQILNFGDEFSKLDNSNVYPLLGKYDQVIKLETQKRGYLEDHLVLADKGHLTGSTSFKLLREHILKEVWQSDKK